MIHSNDGADIRWRQRFDSYKKALGQLTDAVAIRQERPLSRLGQQGLIKAFEFTWELAWNVMKDYFEYQGNTTITGPRDAIREAFGRNLITDGDSWMMTIASRNRSSHTYNEETANLLVQTVATRYLDLFRNFESRMQKIEQEWDNIGD
uniref:Nucleotidyltransferase substrate binding protein, HI0074 family n=1 Tax=Candidatus Kentrum sp. SD TaxID=2126332 RepID=A0A450YAV8_9GAMM|nr:MAG: nucleotidyltransferase substrate binding protein, HI0074 family [Candidatus Kentron sp. SD]VFK38603.1 MAG: nucleotidyltransferase substrate binding protein, HI0074 family [Candidatus Kentron sp. SD]